MHPLSDDNAWTAMAAGRVGIDHRPAHVAPRHAARGGPSNTKELVEEGLVGQHQLDWIAYGAISRCVRDCAVEVIPHVDGRVDALVDYSLSSDRRLRPPGYP